MDSVVKWIGPGTVVVGVGAALLMGTGSAAADAGDSNVSGRSDSGSAYSSSSSASVDSSSSAASSTTTAAPKRPAPGAGADREPSPAPQRTQRQDPGPDIGALTDRDASTVDMTADRGASAKSDRAVPASAGRRQASVPKTVDRIAADGDAAVETIPDTRARDTDRSTSGPVEQPRPQIASASAPLASTEAGSEATDLGATDMPSRNVAAATASVPAQVAAPRRLGPIVTLALTALSTIGWQPGPELVAAIPALGAWTVPRPPVVPIPVETSEVPVDPEQFAGTYYEQGSVKQFFSFGLVNTKAVYTLNPDGTIRVQNSGNYIFPRGPLSSIVGSAVPVNDTNTALNVSFGPIKSATPPGNYLILARADDYSWLIVSDPTGSSGFILTRSRTIDPQTYQELVAEARRLGVRGPITPTAQYPS